MESSNSLLPSEGFFTFMTIRLPYTSLDGVFYVPIKPICDAIGLNHNSAYKGIKNDDFLGELCNLMPQLGSDGKRYEMLSLPWWTLHGWLCSVDSLRVNSEARATLKSYKMICHKVLHDFFVGSVECMTTRRQLYFEIRTLKQRIAERETQLETNELYQQQMNDKKMLKELEKQFKQIDDEEFGKQLQLGD